jgi:hypothetical protein
MAWRQSLGVTGYIASRVIDRVPESPYFSPVSPHRRSADYFRSRVARKNAIVPPVASRKTKKARPMAGLRSTAAVGSQQIPCVDQNL